MKKLNVITVAATGRICRVAGGVLTFRYVSNPVCNSRDLIPPR